MQIRTDRLGVLVDQMDTSVEVSRERLAGLTDEEYLWEPVPGAWSIHRRSAAVSDRAFGPGEWVLDHESDPDPMPFTTIAWRLGHLHSGMAGRYEWTFGGRTVEPTQVVDFSPSAQQTLDGFWAVMDRWRAAVNAMTDEQLDMVGFGQYPFGLDPQLPFIGIIWWTNRELIHHTAEIALLRDLWRAQRRVDPDAPPS